MLPDFALIEVQFPALTHNPTNYGVWEFSAYVETPDALNGVGPTDWLPLQGVALSTSPPGEYFATPVLAFPGADPAGPLGTVAGSDKYCSLRVDLRSLPSTIDTMIIALYGQIADYNITGGTGINDGKEGTLLSSTFYGALTKDYRPFSLTGWTPGALSAAANKLFIKASLGDVSAVMISSFPELAGVPYELLGDGTGDWSINGQFKTGAFAGPWTPDTLATTWGDTLLTRPSGVTPNDNPNPWAWRTMAVPSVGFTYDSLSLIQNWGAGVLKKKTLDCSILELLDNSIGGTGLSYAASVPLTAPAANFATPFNFYQIKYYVPTWNYSNSRSGTIKALGVSGVDLWTAHAQRDSAFDPGSQSWEDPGIYPGRVALADLGTATMESGPSTGDYYPKSHFGHHRLGRILITRSTGAITFEPEVPPPTDGTPDGDGAVGDGSAPGRTDNPHLRVWTFSLDEHDYYVLRLGDSLTLVYDVYSEQWMDWTDFDSLTWRAHCGRNWIGAEALADTYGSNVVVGDDTYGLLWFLDPEQPFDDNPLGAVTPSYFARVTVGQVPMKGREVLPCFAVWLTADMGDPAYSGAAVTLWMSDDAGATWESQGYIQVTPGENRPELAWYSLGQIEAPGRLFKIFDDGAITRIDGLEMNDPDDK
jgi:hypothetical protein